MSGCIKLIKIEKIRHLNNIEINITDDKLKHLILTGKNGSGKTTLLERIRDYLKSIPDDDLLDNDIKKYANGLQIVFNNESEIVKKYREGKYILAYFNATRNVKMDIPTNIEKVQLKEKYDIQENIGEIFVNYLVYLKTQQSFARNEDDMEEVNKIQCWFDKFQKALQTLFEDESIYLKFDYKNLYFTINQDGREAYGFDALSDGYSAVLDIVINLILRMERHFVESYDIEGIVVIDELENHLHIGLQKNILPFLTEFFPNVQFIISTHSPFIINSIDNAVIFDLEKQERVEDLSGIAYEGIVEGYFDINQYSEKIIMKLQRYENLVKKEDKNEEELEEELELRRYLKGISKQLSPEVILSFNQIEINRKYKSKNKN